MDKNLENLLVNSLLLNQAKQKLKMMKKAFVPAGDPAMMGGGMPPPPPPGGGGMPPMDPAMLAAMGGGGMPPIDPAMLAAMGGGGMPPIDPAMLAAMGGGMPPPPPPPPPEGGGGGGQVNQDLVNAIVDGVKEALKSSQNSVTGATSNGPVTGQKFKIDIGLEIMKLSKMVARIADALGINIPAQDLIVTPEEVASLQQQQMLAANSGGGSDKGGSEKASEDQQYHNYSELEDTGRKARLIWLLLNKYGR
jgi:hypothetical protein